MNILRPSNICIFPVHTILSRSTLEYPTFSYSKGLFSFSFTRQHGLLTHLASLRFCPKPTNRTCHNTQPTLTTSTTTLISQTSLITSLVGIRHVPLSNNESIVGRSACLRVGRTGYQLRGGSSEGDLRKEGRRFENRRSS